MKHILTLKTSLFFLSLIAIMSSCGSGGTASKSELEIVSFENIPSEKDNSYPKIIQEIVAPFKEVGEGKLNFGFSPLTIVRKDIDKTITIDYLNNKAVNYKKILALERAVNTYFKDNKTDSVFGLPSATGGDELFETFIDKNKTKKNIFIYSKEDNKYDGCNTFASVSDLRNAVSKLLIQNAEQKIVVVIEPNMTHHDEPTASNSETVETNKNDETVLTDIKTKSEQHVSNDNDDYMALYTLSLVNVYLSKDHHISFNYLRQAVEAAVRSKKATEFSIVIGKDLQAGQQTHNATWKMSTHDDDWGPIMEILSTNGKTVPEHHHH